MVIKMSKIDDSREQNDEEEDDLDDFKIPKNKKRRLEKVERKIREVEKRNERLIYLDFKIGDDIVLNALPASISSKLKRKLEMSEPIKVRRPEKEKLTYTDLQIETPEEFDYENYDRVIKLQLSLNFRTGVDIAVHVTQVISLKDHGDQEHCVQYIILIGIKRKL